MHDATNKGVAEKTSEIIRINKSLVLFDANTGAFSSRHTIHDGSYAVETVPNPIDPGGESWWKIVGEPWGNAQACWATVSVEAPKSRNLFTSRSQCIAGLLALGILIVGAASSLGTFMRRTPPDVVSLKMQFTTLTNELQNLAAHYPLLSTPVQKTYEARKAEALYALDVYPKYVEFRNLVQHAALQRHPELEPYLEALNAIDEQLYHAWHDWGVTNRAGVVAGMWQQRCRFTSGELMAEAAAAYEELRVAVITQDMVAPATAFTETLEHEIADHDPAMRDIARQNRDCADRATALRAKINALGPEIQALQTPRSFLRSAGLARSQSSSL